MGIGLVWLGTRHRPLPGENSPEVQRAIHAATACERQSATKTGTFRGDDGAELCFFAAIAPSSGHAFLDRATRAHDLLVVSSLGGDVTTGLDMAERIRALGMEVVVVGFCVSSCANYLFTAGATKIVLPGGIVGFHGGPSLSAPIIYQGPPALAASSRHLAREVIREIIERQHRFFGEIGVRESLVVRVPAGVHWRQGDWSTHVWAYDRTTLADVFGVGGIRFYATPADLFGFGRLSPAAGLSCTRPNPSAWLCRV